MVAALRCAYGILQYEQAQISMSNTTKKRMAVVRERIQKLHQRVAEARQQCDDPQDLKELEQQLSSALDELSALAAQTRRRHAASEPAAC